MTWNSIGPADAPPAVALGAVDALAAVDALGAVDAVGAVDAPVVVGLHAATTTATRPMVRNRSIGDSVARSGDFVHGAWTKSLREGRPRPVVADAIARVGALVDGRDVDQGEERGHDGDDRQQFHAGLLRVVVRVRWDDDDVRLVIC